MKRLKIIVGCEFSQVVTKAFRALGHEAYSCDLLPYEGGHPEWHYQEDVLEVLKRERFDLGIFHPECTHLATSGNRSMEEKRRDGRQKDAINFFMCCVRAPIKHIAIENPKGVMSSIYRRPDQIIHPYYFGDPYQKTTCLWLKNLPKLVHYERPDLFVSEATHVERGEFVTFKSGKRMPKWYADTPSTNSEENRKKRSTTFPGFAEAMAEQWSEYILRNKEESV